MSLIIPYNEYINSKGAFITLNGNFLTIQSNHENFAHDFCNGKDYNNLLKQKKDNPNIDIYKSSMLTKEQLQLYKLWLKKYKYSKDNNLCDFLVYLLAFDKVETILEKAITTTSLEPHIRFYNYYLMNWHIDIQKPLHFNEKTKEFEHINISNWLSYKDKETETEINEIKQSVVIRDRHLFFK